MKYKIMSLLCLTVLGLSACVVDLSDDDVVRSSDFSLSLNEMASLALDDCGRGNINTVSNTDYSCFNGGQGSSNLKAIENIALKTCKGHVQEVTVTGFICE